MCGRYVTPGQLDLEREFAVVRPLWEIRASWNVAPTQKVPVVRLGADGVREGAVVAVSANDAGARQGLVIAAEFKGDDESTARSQVVSLVASECGIVPADVVFLKPGSLPRTSSGKLRRLEVRRTLETVGS